MKKLGIALLVIISLVLFLRFVVGGPEDDWICENGQWVKHGNPSSPKPESDCRPQIVKNVQNQLEDASVCYSPSGKSMAYKEAEEIGIKKCLEGELLDTHFCNSSSGTWWIDFTPIKPSEGCNPACVVFIDTGETEINWRCTGLINPTND